MLSDKGKLIWRQATGYDFMWIFHVRNADDVEFLYCVNDYWQMNLSTEIPRPTSEPDNEFFG